MDTANFSAEDDRRLMHLLRLAGEYEIKQILESDEAFEKFLKDNPLTPAEQAEAKAMVQRLVNRFRKA